MTRRTYLDESQARRQDALVFAWFVPEHASELGTYYLDILGEYHPAAKHFIGMNHGSDPVWEERIMRSDLDAEVRWARPDLGDYWDATGFVTALEGFFHSREDFDFVWFGHTKGGSKQFNDDQHIRSELIDTFWERRGDVARAFGDPAIGLFAPRYNLTPPYPFAGPPHGWTNQLSALQRVYRDARPPLGLCALDTFFVIRGDIVRRFCDAVGEEFFRTDPGTYGANKWFFEMAFPSIASMQGFVPWIDMDVPGVNDPRDDLMLSWDVKQTHRLAIAEVARWREDLTGFQPRIIAWDRLPWEQPRSKRDRSDPDLVIGELKSDEARLRNPPQLARSIAHRVEAEGWHVPPGESAMQPLLDAPNHSLRVVFPTPPRDAFRIRLALTLKDMEVLRLGLWSAIDDELPRERNVWLDGARPGALHHELERVALYANPALAYFELELEGALAPGEQLGEVTLVPADASLCDVPASAEMAITLHRVEAEQLQMISHSTRFVPERFADRPVPQRYQDRPRDAVVFAWFVPDGMPELGEYYLHLLRYFHPDSKLFIGMNHGSDPIWEERFCASGLDVEVRWARPEIGDYWDTTGFITALEGFHESDETFALVWFGHTKGGSQAFNDYMQIRFAQIRTFWSRREQIERIFTDAKVGIFAPRFSPLPTGFFGDELPALLRIYRATHAPVGLHAKETFFVMRDEIVRNFCQAVGADYFRTDPGTYGTGRYFFEIGFPNVATIQGYEPFIDPDVPGDNHPRDDAWLWFDHKQNHRLASTELERWRRDPIAFEPKAMRQLWDPTWP